MPCAFLPLVLRLPRTLVAVAAAPRRTVLAGLVAAVLAVAAGTAVAAPPAGLVGSGVASGAAATGEPATCTHEVAPPTNVCDWSRISTRWH